MAMAILDYKKVTWITDKISNKNYRYIHTTFKIDFVRFLD